MNDHDDFSIELGQSFRRHIEQKKSPREDGKLVALPYDSPEKDSVPIFIAEHVMRSIEQHVGREMDREVGGVLLGGFYRGGKGTFIEITDFIEAKATVGTHVSLTFTHETWAHLNEEQSRRGLESQIVGWYHSHPGLGIFMSREDQFIHSSYFTEPWHVALVVDPICHDWGCFKRNKSDLVQTGGFYVSGEKRSAKRVREYVKQADSSRQTAPQSASASADRGRNGRSTPNLVLWAIILLLVIAQAVTCYHLVSHKPKPKKIGYYKMAVEQLSRSDLSGGEYYLRRELAVSPDSEPARKELARLALIRSKQATASYDNSQLDLINFNLYVADKIAEGGMKIEEKSFLEQIEQWIGSGDKLGRQSQGPSVQACKAYDLAKLTFEARLSRAKLIARIAKGKLEYTSPKTWYNKAVTRLRQEHLYRIAYGMRSGNEQSSREFEGLSRKEQKTVNGIQAKLNKPK